MPTTFSERLIPLQPFKDVAASKPGGIYVHIPFCLRKCRYCDFYSTTDLSYRKPFVQALLHEITKTPANALTFDSLYIGGGTPSVLELDQIKQIVNHVKDNYRLLVQSEITLEINPGVIAKTHLLGYRDCGINRINIGVQSFQQVNLDFLGRIHTVAQTHNLMEMAVEAGFANIGIDLISGLPEQTKESLLADLRQAVAYRPHHIACYTLTYEPKTILGRDYQLGRVLALNDKRIAELFRTTQHFLAENGYQQYEISNYARISNNDYGHYRSRHNQKYWSMVPYVGLGPAAHSFTGNIRYWNMASIQDYLNRLHDNRLPIDDFEWLTLQQQMMESLYLGLRTCDGIVIDSFQKKFEVNFETLFGEPVKDFQMRGYLYKDDRVCKLTPQGMLLLDSITDAFVSLI